MTGIERLRAFARRMDELGVWPGGAKLLDIADQIERELREERSRWESAPCAGCMWREGCEGFRERPRKATDALAGRLRENVAVAAILRLVSGGENGPESRESDRGGEETT